MKQWTRAQIMKGLQRMVSDITHLKTSEEFGLYTNYEVIPELISPIMQVLFVIILLFNLIYIKYIKKKQK